MISASQTAFFRDNGYVVLPGVLHACELDALRTSTARLIDRARFDAPADDVFREDFQYEIGHDSATRVLKRIEYVVHRLPECRALLAHPFVLATVARLIGNDIVPTWDSMVVKMPDEGIVVPWHRDAPTTQVGDHPIFNVDWYLDASDRATALWVLPGSHRLNDSAANAEVLRRNADRFDTAGAVQVPMQAGDVLLHDILLLHGSPPSRANPLRCVVYFEYRSARIEAERGPHTLEYIPLKQQVLAACIEWRRGRPYIDTDESAFEYAPPAPFDGFPRGAPDNFRWPHARYWRRA